MSGTCAVWSAPALAPARIRADSAALPSRLTCLPSAQLVLHCSLFDGCCRSRLLLGLAAPLAYVLGLSAVVCAYGAAQQVGRWQHVTQREGHKLCRTAQRAGGRPRSTRQAFIYLC